MPPRVRHTERLMNRAIRNNLAAWDGVHIGHLIEVYTDNASRRGFFEDLLGICADAPDLQRPATWLMKHHYDLGHTMPDAIVRALSTLYPSVQNWEAKLHLLQLLPQVELAEDSIVPTEQFVRRCLKDDNKFVRAWAFSGFFALTKPVPRLRSELAQICQVALDTESPSVKSKARRVLLALKAGKQ